MFFKAATMRLVIDLQAAQGSSRARGIGRYSRELALAMIRDRREHEVIVAHDRPAFIVPTVSPRAAVRRRDTSDGASSSAEGRHGNVLRSEGAG